MTLLIVCSIIIGVLSYGLCKAGEALEQGAVRKQAENEARDLAVLEASGALRRIAEVFEGPEPEPVSTRISKARSSLDNRAEVREAMERELGVK
jgi:hypothetical protein